MIFVCPKCGEKLERQGNSYKCPNGHSFDISKQGYVNLLLGSKGGNHGDNKLMAQARRNFLDKGYYKKFADALVNTAAEFSKPGDVLIDCGCGEGYYTSQISDSVNNISVAGFDISKNAAAIAAKRNKNVSFAVASSFSIPLEDSSADIALEIFSPHCEREFKRILKTGGLLIMAIPLENHLYSLKKAVYDNAYKNSVNGFEIDGFELIKNTEIKYSELIKSNEDIKNLFMMTPYYYKTGEKEQARLNTLQELCVELEFSITVYKKLG